MQSGTTADLSLDKLFCLSYGSAGTGKSVWSWTWPGALVMDVGRELIGAKARGLDFPFLQPDKWEDIIDFYQSPAETIEKYHPGYDAKTIIVDTVSDLCTQGGICMDFVMATRSGSKKDGSKMFEYPAQSEMGRVTEKMRGFFILSRQLPYNVLLIAHEHTEKDGLTGELFDLPAMMGQMRKQAANLPDICLWHQVEGRGENKEYVAYSTKHIRNVGKDRFGCLPERMVNPTYQQVRQCIDQQTRRSANAVT